MLYCGQQLNKNNQKSKLNWNDWTKSKLKPEAKKKLSRQGQNPKPKPYTYIYIPFKMWERSSRVLVYMAFSSSFLAYTSANQRLRYEVTPHLYEYKHREFTVHTRVREIGWIRCCEIPPLKFLPLQTWYADSTYSRRRPYFKFWAGSYAIQRTMKSHLSMQFILWLNPVSISDSVLIICQTEL